LKVEVLNKTPIFVKDVPYQPIIIIITPIPAVIVAVLITLDPPVVVNKPFPGESTVVN
jgi:hypothetical protein